MTSALQDSFYTPYSSYQSAAKAIEAITPIDYFLAQEVIKAQRNQIDLQHEQTDLLFHLTVLVSQKLREGHTCLPTEKAAGSRIGYSADQDGIITHQGFLFPDISVIDSVLNIFRSGEQLLVLRNKNLYLRRYADFESELTKHLAPKLQANATNVRHYELANIASAIKLIFPESSAGVKNETDNKVASKPNNLSVNSGIDWQKIAVANALNKDFSIIAGGPGTGKTFTVTKLLAALVLLEHQIGRQPIIKLTAPTGKAAQRLSESIIDAVSKFKLSFISTPIFDLLDQIPNEAQTLHRLLGVIPNSPNFRHHQDNLLAVDILLIDEVSMVDLPMMTRIFRALPVHTKVILLGDADQLPSVAAGSVLADLAPRPHHGFSPENISYLSQVNEERVIETFAAKRQPAMDHVTFLLKSRRFDGKGIIGRVAKQVIEGDAKGSWKTLNEPLEINNDELLSLATKVQIQPNQAPLINQVWLKELVNRYYQPLFGDINVTEAFSLLSLFRILAATRQGEYGVESLNEAVKEILVKQRLVNPMHQSYQGLPIMINQNDYRLGLYNGDVGLMWKHENGQLMAAFETEENEVRWVLPSRLPSYEPVYAMTIHKTQGSEFNHVAMVLPMQTDNKLLSRELLYTGITRAKSKLNVVCRENVWQGAVISKVERHSGLFSTPSN